MYSMHPAVSASMSAAARAAGNDGPSNPPPKPAGGKVHGGVVIGTRDPGLARRLVANIASVFDFSTTPSALLGERLHAYLRTVEMWNSVTDVLASGAFRPVYPTDRRADDGRHSSVMRR